MEKIMVVVFDEEKKAYEGQRSLRQLEADGTISIHSMAVVTKSEDGAVTFREPDNLAPLGMVSGSVLGSLIGVLGGPAGWAAGALAGGFFGAVLDLSDSGVSADFLDEVQKTLIPGKTAVLVEVYENWVTPVDTQMEKLGGVLFRGTWPELVNTRERQAIAAYKAEIARLEAERAQASAERKAKLQAQIDERRAKLESAYSRSKAKAEAAKREADAKVKGLQDRAANAKADLKTKYEERIAKIRAVYDQRVKKLNEAIS